MAKATCSVDGCERTTEAQGFCGTHYQRWRKHGDPQADRSIQRGNIPRPVVDRIADRLDFAPGGCWLWLGSSDPRGYGRIDTRVDGRKAPRLVYRVLWEAVVGPVPDGLELDHLCRTPACVNPDHLEPVTHAENLLRGESPAARNARKTHCKRGHEFTHENTWVNPRTGGRQCRACFRLRKKGPVSDADDRAAPAT